MRSFDESAQLLSTYALPHCPRNNPSTRVFFPDCDSCDSLSTKAHQVVWTEILNPSLPIIFPLLPIAIVYFTKRSKKTYP